MRAIYIIAVLLATFTGAGAQEKGEKARGRAIVQIYTNFHSGFGAVNDDRGFALDRSYIGYEYMPGRGLTLKGVLDVGQSSDVNDYQRIAYIKNAFVGWRWRWLTLNGGLIPTTQFNYQENFWGYRYVYNSFQDQYGFGSSADLGISAAYKAADWFSADAIIVNGEGYKKVQMGKGLCYGVGATLTPVKGLQVRLYGGLNDDASAADADQWNAAAFVGYKAKAFSVGAEYNYMDKAGNEQNGYSVYTTVNVSDEAAVYARWDDLFAGNTATSAVAIMGAQFKVGKYVKIAPNVRMQLDHATGKDTYAGYVSCYFGL